MINNHKNTSQQNPTKAQRKTYTLEDFILNIRQKAVNELKIPDLLYFKKSRKQNYEI